MRLDNLLVTAPSPRNPLLADAFKRAGIVERTARGIDTIFYEQLRNGRPAPSYARSGATGVVLSIPGGEANLDSCSCSSPRLRAGAFSGSMRCWCSMRCGRRKRHDGRRRAVDAEVRRAPRCIVWSKRD